MTEVQIHVHNTMRGSYPLCLLDVLFCERQILLVEYGYLTALSLATDEAERRAAAFAETLADGGLPAARETAEHERAVAYADLDAVVVYDGGRYGREKLVLDGDGSPVHVRVHGDLDVAALTAALRGVVGPHGVDVERRRGAGVFDRIRGISPR